MAEYRRFSCSRCSRSFDAWDEGDPYYRDKRGRKRYAYHPDPRRKLCTGVESSALCLDCGTEAVRDSADPIQNCQKCDSGALVDMWGLGGKRCPFCQQGTFEVDDSFLIIS